MIIRHTERNKKHTHTKVHYHSLLCLLLLQKQLYQLPSATANLQIIQKTKPSHIQVSTNPNLRHMQDIQELLDFKTYQM